MIIIFIIKILPYFRSKTLKQVRPYSLSSGHRKSVRSSENKREGISACLMLNNSNVCLIYLKP